MEVYTKQGRRSSAKAGKAPIRWVQ